MLNINPNQFLKKFKLVKTNTLFPLEFEGELLEKKACPMCGKKLALTLKGMYICKGKHKPSFAIKQSKLI